MSDWVRHGECNRCGHCCEHFARDVQVRTVEHVQRDAAYYLARGFRPTATPDGVRFVLWAWVASRCGELDIVDGQPACRLQERKPQTCVAFPQHPRDIVGTPCSYWFERHHERVGGDGSPHATSVERFMTIEQTA